MARALFGGKQSHYSVSTVFSAGSKGEALPEEEPDLNELDWEISLRHHMGTFTQFDSIPSTERIQWAKDNLPEELNAHASKRAQFEEDRRKWAKEKEEMMVRNLFELRKEIVCAWMRIEEREWLKSREEWEQEANAVESEFRSELMAIQGIPPPPRRKKFGKD